MNEVTLKASFFVRSWVGKRCTLVTELSDISALAGRRMMEQPTRITVCGNAADVDFTLVSSDCNADGDVCGWNYQPTRLAIANNQIPAGTTVFVLIIND